jgi:hypothetical protein
VRVKGIFEQWSAIRMVRWKGGHRGGLFAMVLWILLVPASSLWAQGVRYDNIVLGPRGGPVGAASIAVCAAGASTGSAPCSPLASIYSDEALTQPLANPMQADSLGNYGFWAAPGHYVVQIYGTGVSTRTMNVFLPCDPSNCSMSEASISSITAGTLNLTGSLTVNGRGVATKPLVSDSFVYVSPNGSDSNDGFSWGTAKQTVWAAYQALEAAGKNGGTILISEGASCGGPNNALWIMGPMDPQWNNGNVPTGWLPRINVKFEGVSSVGAIQNGSPAAVDVSCGSATAVPLWIAGSDWALTFENLSFQGNGAQHVVNLGLASTGSTTTASGAQNVRFINCHFNGYYTASASLGPAVYVASNVFWIWFENGGISANQSAAEDSDQRMAIVFNPGAVSSADTNLIFLHDMTINYGGIKFYNDATNDPHGNASLHVSGVTFESLCSAYGGIWLTSSITAGAFTFRNVTLADSCGALPAIYVGDANNPGTVLVDNVLGDNGGVPVANGPAEIVSSSWQGWQHASTDPLVTGLSGILDGTLYAQNDSGRRLFGATAAIGVNYIDQTSFSYANGAVNTPVAAPDGTNNAFRLQTTTTGTAVYLNYNAQPTLAVGGYVYGGMWVRDNTPAYGFFKNINIEVNCGSGGANGVNLLTAIPSVTVSGGSFGLFAAFPASAFVPDGGGLGDWIWYPFAMRVTSLGTGGCSLQGYISTSNTSQQIDVFAPAVYYAAPGTITDSEAAWRALNGSTVPETVSAGVVSTLRGHPFAFGGSGDSYMATLDHTTLTANRTYSFPNANGNICLSTTCGSQVGQISISSATSASQSFGTSYNSPPVCVVSPTANPGSITWWVTATTTGVTLNLSASATVSFNYVCFGNPN